MTDAPEENDRTKIFVVHCKISKYDVYVGRPSIFGNIYSHKNDTKATHRTKTQEEAVQKYAEWIATQEDILAEIPSLKGKILGCWCAPKNGLSCSTTPYICHAQILAELANF